MALQEELHATLTDMLQAINEGSGEVIAAKVRRIDEIHAALGGEAPPMLRHYLERRSYTKALDFLEGRDETVTPNC
jgi:hypothetical protein